MQAMNLQLLAGFQTGAESICGTRHAAQGMIQQCTQFPGRPWTCYR